MFTHIIAGKERERREKVPDIMPIEEVEDDAGLVEVPALGRRVGPVRGALEEHGHRRHPRQYHQQQSHYQLHAEVFGVQFLHNK